MGSLPGEPRLKEVIVRKTISKLVLAVALLTGSLTGMLSPKAAVAGGFCSDYCLDPDCNCVIHCRGIGGSCLCEDHCSME
jgi:hypothetical protein